MNNSRIAFTLWLLSVIGFVAHSIDAPISFVDLVSTTTAFAILMGLYLSFSSPRVGEAIQRLADKQAEFGIPGILWIIFLALTLFAATPEPWFMLALAGTIFWLPIVLINRNQSALTPQHALLGLAVLLLPLGLDVVIGLRALDTTALLLRIGAFMLPVLLILTTTREQKQRLSFLFVSAVLFLWFTIEFGNFPILSLPFDGGLVQTMQLAIVALLLYVLALVGRLPELGFSFALNRKDWLETGINLIALSLIGITLGLLSGFIRPSTSLPGGLEIIGRGIAIFFFIALPEEILFRGAIHRYLERVLHWTPHMTLLLSSIIFGAAHLNNPPNVGWYFVLASISGWFYGRTYLRTGKIVPAALVHFMINWTWSIFFAG